MASDPYAALGLSRGAGTSDIKSAYRRIVKTDHPDVNPDPEATARFKAATAAYDLLKDEDRRRRFDAGEIDADGNEKMAGWGRGGGNPFGQGPSHGDPDLSDIFADLFGQAQSQQGRRGGFGGFGGFGGGTRRGEDLRMAMRVDFMTAATGGRKRITLPDGGTLEVTIPKGVRDGQSIRLRGKGEPGMGRGPAGDLYLEVSVDPHPQFRREGDDVHVILPITIDEAVLGAKVAAPTIDGPVRLSIPAGATSGQKMRLRGRGINGGDQHVELRVAMPEPDEELAAFLTEWRKTRGYDPRG
ncbi:DnaJ C-terminal domain-containing protein [Paracoccus zeaxanthinifaciens]|uniref:DnaJ C-terminal domain-containing protein n=1 Tax=Paracoccus zeaxanthinifaciens TaxID=187400 RepID=UPI0003B706F6|nr:DnaJ C-terminal domain-containing protein [Paracoccus zeaxanthinifaciens]